MTKFIEDRSQKTGLSPGTLRVTAERRDEPVRVTSMTYGETELQERQIDLPDQITDLGDRLATTWINVDGLYQLDWIEALGKHFQLHPLTLEDIVHIGQRPKLEAYEGYHFAVLQMLGVDSETNELEDEQVTLVIGPDFVLSFQEREGDVFDAVRERIRSGRARLRRSGSDYLAYTLFDAIVDHYFVVLEKLGDRIEEIEEQLISDPSPETLYEIQALKRDLLYMRKSIWPLREVLSSLQREESALIQNDTKIYLRDVYDHTIQVIDTVETLRDMVSGMLDIYLSSVSNRMNEVMKVLTIIATIFIPLTFIAGVYGMNLNMPELSWPWSYPAVLGVMGAVAVVMLIYFKRKNWL